jgi:hypothetical protein
LKEQAVQVSFGFTAEVGVTETLDDVNLYVIDEQGDVVRTASFPHVEGGKQYAVDVDVPHGTYDIVVWSSQNNPFRVSLATPSAPVRYGADEERLSRMHGSIFSLMVPPTRRVTELIPPLFYGRLLDVELGDLRNHTLPVDMEELTNTLHVNVIGLQREMNTTFSISDNNGAYYFDQCPAPCDTFSYSTRLTADAEGRQSGTLRVIRLGDERSPMIELRDDNSGELLYPTDDTHIPCLVTLIKQQHAASHPDEEFSFKKQHNYQLTFRFDTDMSVRVDVNNWTTVTSEEELD